MNDTERATLHLILHEACSRGDENFVREILSDHDVANIDLEAKHPTHGRTPLLAVCWEGHSNIAEILIGRGANVHAKDEEDFACLHAAAYHGHVEIIDLLLDAGANIECLDDGRCGCEVKERGVVS